MNILVYFVCFVGFCSKLMVYFPKNKENNPWKEVSKFHENNSSEEELRRKAIKLHKQNWKVSDICSPIPLFPLYPYTFCNASSFSPAAVFVFFSASTGTGVISASFLNIDNRFWVRDI